LYKKGKQLGKGYYIVEISSNNNSLYVAAYDVESPESLLIELSEKKAQEILAQFQNDYEKMATSLNVINKRLVLLNPVNSISVNNLICRHMKDLNQLRRKAYFREDWVALQAQIED
jgi:hypothetical protein